MPVYGGSECSSVLLINRAWPWWGLRPDIFGTSPQDVTPVVPTPVVTILSGSVAVPANQVQLSIYGTFASTYQAIVSTSWVTATDVEQKSSANFLVTFAVPCPTTGGTLDWITRG